jgi:hypothetical protein
VVQGKKLAILMLVLAPVWGFAQEFADNSADLSLLIGDIEVHKIPEAPSFRPALSAPISGGSSRSANVNPQRSSVSEIGIGSSLCGVSVRTRPSQPTGSSVEGIPLALKPRIERSRSVSRANKKGGSLGKGMSGMEALDIADIAVDKFINIGKKVWEIVEAGRPVVDLQTDVATALPMTDSGEPVCWTEMENWRVPQSQRFAVILKNRLGEEAVHLEYRVIYQVGGSFEGRGRYIAYAAVQPMMVNVNWGWTLLMNAEVLGVANTGTTEDPVPGMTLLVNYRVKTVFQDTPLSKTFFITGLGEFQEIQ